MGRERGKNPTRQKGDVRGAERCIMSRALPRDSEARALHVRSGTGRTIKSVIACNCRAYVFPIGSERKEERGDRNTVGLNTLR